jgi:prophage DNA circulation protein
VQNRIICCTTHVAASAFAAVLSPLSQAEQQRELSAVAAAEADAVAGALSRKMQMQEASSKEVQRLREESAELRE